METGHRSLTPIAGAAHSDRHARTIEWGNVMVRAKRVQALVTIVLAIGLALAAPAPTGATQLAAATGSASVVAGGAPLLRISPKYLVCNPAKWPGANPVYPYGFDLSTRYRYTDRARIRASVRSIQRVIDDRIWGDQLNPKKRVHIAVDGSYGPQTRAAVKKFQAANKLTVTGRVGPRTWRALASYCGSD